MKRKICALILVLFLISISLYTVYIINNVGINKPTSISETKKIKLSSSNIDDNSISKLFNVYLNGLKHRLKVEYNFTKEATSLVIYLDGNPIFQENVVENYSAPNIKELFKESNIIQYVDINEQNFEIIKTDQDYLVLKIGYYNGQIKQKYFIINEHVILNKYGILIRDSSQYYIDNSNQELTIFYGENQIMAYIEINSIYSLELENNENVYNFLEYKYKIENNNFTKELINTYNYIKIKEDNIEGE